MTRIGLRNAVLAASMVLAPLGLRPVVATPAAAHHGWAGYENNHFELTGTVEEVHLGNPHGHLAMRNGDGLWDVVLGPPFRNRRAGIVDDSISVGDTVTARGHRHVGPERLEMKTERLVAGERVFYIYPNRD